MAYASSRSQGELAFRLPLSLQIVPPLFIFIGAIFIPESPRWLTMWGKRDQAARILAKYHGGGDPSHPLVQLELREFESTIELQKASSVWNYCALVNTHNARWRLAMVAFMSVFAQLSGNSVLTYYLPSMYKLLGIVSTERRLLLTFMNSIVSCAGAVAGSATNDRIGRRTKLWVGSFVLAALFGAVTGFSSQFQGQKQVGTGLSNGGVAFVSLPSGAGPGACVPPSVLTCPCLVQIFLFGCAYSFVYTPLTATYCAEVLANPTRAKGMGVVGSRADLFDPSSNAYLCSTSSSPTAPTYTTRT